MWQTQGYFCTTLNLPGAAGQHQSAGRQNRATFNLRTCADAVRALAQIVREFWQPERHFWATLVEGPFNAFLNLNLAGEISVRVDLVLKTSSVALFTLGTSQGIYQIGANLRVLLDALR